MPDACAHQLGEAGTMTIAMGMPIGIVVQLGELVGSGRFSRVGRAGWGASNR